MLSGTFSLAALLGAGLAAAHSGGLINPLTRFSNMTLELPPQDFPVLHTDFRFPPDCGETSYNGTGRLKGLRALITGGDSGIGRAMTIAFLREGAEVAINYLPEEEVDAQALADLLEPEGLSFERIPGDLLNEDFCTELVNETNDRLGGLDIVVNHAGYAGFTAGPNWRPIEEMDSDELEHIFRLNVYASLHITRAAVPLLPPGGSLIFTASNLAGAPNANSVLYGASKATLVHLTRSLALQLAPRGIRVNAVAPGPVYTPFLAAQGTTTEELEFVTQIPMGRIAQPVEISPLYVDLADPYMTYVSGETFSGAGALPAV